MKDTLVVQLTAMELRALVRDEVSAALAQVRPVTEPTPVLDSEGAARFLHLPVDTLRKRVRAGEIPSFKIGNLLRFRVAELEAWIDSRKGAA